MESIRQYILSVVAAGLLCAIAKGLLPEKGLVAALLNLVCGVFLTVVLLSPVKKLEISDFSQLWTGLSDAGSSFSREGEELAEEAMTEIIKSRAEAYILDKAQTLREDIHVEIGLDESLSPARAEITGTVSPYGRSVLSAYMEDTLGIAKENQTWIG